MAMRLVADAKTTVPDVPPGVVERAALWPELDGIGDVGLVCAPAGYGKTLLLAAWARRSAGADTAWVSLDPDDDDPQRLWSAVLAAVRRCPSVPPSSRLRAPWEWPAGGQPEFLAEFVAALEDLPRPLRLVLDDVHELAGPESLHGIQTFLRNRPPAVVVVLSSRFDAALGLHRLRIAQRLRELRADRLRFSRDEAAAFLDAAGLRLTPPQLDALLRRTDGWPAGLQLAATALADGADPEELVAHFSGDERPVADYLAGEVLANLPEDVLEFLRLVSVGDVLPVGLAAELSGREDAGSVLDTLDHRTGMVRATGRTRETYRLPPLLRTYLAADLNRHHAGDASRLHATAARWWAGEDQPVAALDHAVSSGDPELVVDLLRRFAVPLLLGGHHRRLRQALCMSGARVVASDPRLSVLSALVHHELGEHHAARGAARQAYRAWPADPSAELTVLRTVAEGCGVLPGGRGGPPGPADDLLPAAPELEALARLARGIGTLREPGGAAGARADLGVALALARRHDFGYLELQCLTLLGGAAALAGDLPAMRGFADQAVA
ncbi:MAG TPA: LuxR family transcriptional regulator, partial [Pseudonocardia sp.]|nr:LuxR family transcriptional regulator [Pseudonocardia sp.]